VLQRPGRTSSNTRRQLTAPAIATAIGALAKRAAIRLACTFAGEACVRAVDLVYAAAGGSAIYESGRIDRCFRDVHVAVQHIGLTPNNYELAGRVLLGLEPGTPRF
jgi:alkylation response protein AidB-like acyl-CoA dehydrogenase